MEETIVIAGAGAAGLFAARELSKSGYKVIITEANNRVGGRIHTLSAGHFNQHTEAGAEFIHGKLPITFKLLREANISFEKVDGEMYQVNNGHWKKQEDMAPHWNELINRMKSLDEDMTIAGFLQKYFPGPPYADLREQVARFAEGFDVADISKASVFAVRNEWQDEMENTFRVNGGYGQLVDYLKNECLAAGCELVTNCLVKDIEWKKHHVKLSAANGVVVEGNRCIITVPVGVLQNDALHFSPAIDDYISAAKQIGFGSVVKILFQFKEPFWLSNADDVGFIFSKEIIPTWWTQLPSNSGLLTGWLGGQQVLRVKGRSQKEIGEIAIDSLSKTVNIPAADLKAMLIAQEVHDWSSNPFSQGAYSYSMLPTSEARKKFCQPVDDTIYFAGEGYYEGSSSATVEAALDSARKVVEKIQK
jgi:monoamine oxidase